MIASATVGKPGFGGELAGVDAVRITGLGEQLLRLLRDPAATARCLQGVLHDARHDDPGRRAEAEAGRLVDRLPVERVIDRLPQPHVVPRRFRVPLVGELDPEDRGVLRRHDLQTRGLLDALGVGAVERVGDIGLAGLQHQRAGRRLGHAAHDQGLDVRHAAPIAGKGLQHDLDAGLGADEFVRAGADRVLLEAVIADFRHVFLRHDDAGGGRGRAVERHEIGPRLLQVKPHDPRIDDLDLLDVLLQRLGAGAVVALEAELDVLGRHRVAVVERQVPGAA